MEGIVYRVEMPDGLGPYRSSCERPRLRGSLDCHRPAPCDDWELRAHGVLRADRPPEHLRFGFESVESLRQWFGPDLPALGTCHARVVVYWAREQYAGDFQVLFNPATARVLASWHAGLTV